MRKDYRKMKFLVYSISVFVLFQLQLFSQTGSIKGKITDGKNPVPFVNVIFLIQILVQEVNRMELTA